MIVEENNITVKDTLFPLKIFSDADPSLAKTKIPFISLSIQNITEII